MPNSSPVLSVRDVATELDVSVWTIRIWIKEGRLPAFRFGKLYKVGREALNEFKQGARVRASAA
jgi:excisionase family DNA binding protein